MSNQKHPITPPPEMVEKWAKQVLAIDGPSGELTVDFDGFATQAARWGADQELESCLEWVIKTPLYDTTFSALRTARRPKSPSDKEMALHILDTHGDLTRAEADTIRRALEALPND